MRTKTKRVPSILKPTNNVAEKSIKRSWMLMQKVQEVEVCLDKMVVNATNKVLFATLQWKMLNIMLQI